MVTLIYMAGFSAMESVFGLWAESRYAWGAREVGLIDGLGDLRGIMRAHYGDKVRLVFRRLGLLPGADIEGYYGYRNLDRQEIGNVAAFLVSERNSYMTGTTVEVCGGFNRYI